MIDNHVVDQKGFQLLEGPTKEEKECRTNGQYFTTDDRPRQFTSWCSCPNFSPPLLVDYVIPYNCGQGVSCKQWYYIVAKGWVPRIYKTWSEAKGMTNRFKGAQHEKFDSQA